MPLMFLPFVPSWSGVIKSSFAFSLQGNEGNIFGTCYRDPLKSWTMVICITENKAGEGGYLNKTGKNEAQSIEVSGKDRDCDHFWYFAINSVVEYNMSKLRVDISNKFKLMSIFGGIRGC